MSADECTFTQKQFFALRDDELSAAFANAVSTHLDECAECTRFYARLDVMLRSSRESDPELLLRSTPDSLFDKIASELESPAPAEPAGLDFDAIRQELQPKFTDKQANDLFARIEEQIASETSGQHEAAADALFARITAQVRSAERSDSDPGSTGALDTGARQDNIVSFAVAATHGDAPREPALPISDSFADDDFEDEMLVERGGYAWAGWAALAAVVIGALVFGLTRGVEDTTTPPTQEDGTVAAPTPALDEVSPIEELADPIPAAKPIGDALAELAPTWEGDDVVRVFGDDAAEWTVTGESERVLALHSGTVMVEFVPEDGETLRVVTDAYTIDVVGTVFFATTDDDIEAPVGVLTGGIDVQAAGEETTSRVESAQAWSRTGTVAALDDQSMAELASRVSPDEHAARLRAREEALAARALSNTTPEPASEHTTAGTAVETSNRSNDQVAARQDEEPAEPAVAPIPTSPLERGREALRNGDADRAAREFERALMETTPNSPLAATLHLDLARLYSDRLGRPLNAAGHLRTFLDRFPDDVAAELALRELCRLVDDLGQSEARCGGDR